MRRIAERVGPNGAVVGVDCAANFVRIARAKVPDRFAGYVEFVVEDAAVADLRGPYDHAFSRFGTKFFAFPASAMRNVRRPLKPGGTFMQIVLRKRQDNPWLYEAELRVKEIVPVVSYQDTDQVHCGPGPFSMADADVVSSMLRDAGFDRIAFERFDCDICIGRDMDDAIDFAMSLGPAGEIRSFAWLGRKAENVGLRSLLHCETFSSNSRGNSSSLRAAARRCCMRAKGRR